MTDEQSESSPDTGEQRESTEARAAAEAYAQKSEQLLEEASYGYTSVTMDKYARGALGTAFLAGYQAGRARGLADGMEKAAEIVAGYFAKFKEYAATRYYLDLGSSNYWQERQAAADEISRAIRAAAKGEKNGKG